MNNLSHVDEEGVTNIIVREDIHEVHFSYKNEASKTKVLCTACLGKEIANAQITTLEMLRKGISDKFCSKCGAMPPSIACVLLGVDAQELDRLSTMRLVYTSPLSGLMFRVKAIPFSV
jgi:hypothetical protein